MYFLNDEARVGNLGSFDKLFSMIICACKKNSACGYFFPAYATLGANAPVLDHKIRNTIPWHLASHVSILIITPGRISLIKFGRYMANY